MIYKFNKIHISFVLIILLLLSCGKDFSKIKVATYSGGAISAKSLLDEYAGLSEDEKKSTKSYDDFYKLVRKIALEKIIIENAVRDGLDRRDDFINKIEETKNSIGFEILKKKNVTDKILIVENDFLRYKKAYTLYQIVKRSDILNENKLAESKRFLDSLSKSIKTLEQFKETAAKYSDDITSKKGGYVGEIRIGIMEEEIDKQLEKLGVGKVSTVIETSVGYHLIFIESEREKNIEELIRDKSIYDEIYRMKEEELENQWYEKLLKDNSYKLNETVLKEKKKDGEIVAQYDNEKITRKEVFETVEKLRQNGAFPEPTFDELIRLVKNLSLGMILNKKIASDSVISTKEFSEKLDVRKRFLLRDTYVSENLKIKEITSEEINAFYDENKKTLFTFKLENGKDFLQPLNEVEEFIKQKIEETRYKESRYELYKMLIEESNFNVIEKELNSIIQITNKTDKS